MKKNKCLEEIKRKCGGGKEADFEKHPVTQEEISACIERLGCVSLQNIAYHRRKIRIGGNKWQL